MSRFTRFTSREIFCPNCIDDTLWSSGRRGKQILNFLQKALFFFLAPKYSPRGRWNHMWTEVEFQEPFWSTWQMFQKPWGSLLSCFCYVVLKHHLWFKHQKAVTSDEKSMPNNFQIKQHLLLWILSLLHFSEAFDALKTLLWCNSTQQCKGKAIFYRLSLATLWDELPYKRVWWMLCRSSGKPWEHTMGMRDSWRSGE